MPTPSSRRRARVTSSRTRSERKPASPKPVSTGSARGRQARARVSEAKVTKSGDMRPLGAKPARVTSTDTRALAQNRSVFEAKENPRITRGAGTPSRSKAAAGKVAGAAKALKGGAIVAAAKEGLTARNTASGTLKGKPTGPAQGPKAPERLTKTGIDKMKFDDAFRQARKSGQKEFTWRGKRYNTKTK
jgi:hypothetical protein